MKTLLLLMVLALPMSRSSHASGCGGPEFYRVGEARLISIAMFRAEAQSHDIELITYLGQPAQLSLIVYTQMMAVPGVNSFYWHRLPLEGAVPEGVSLTELDAALMQGGATIEVVEDAFQINCADVYEGVQSNLRVKTSFAGKNLEFRTGYLPFVER